MSNCERMDEQLNDFVDGLLSETAAQDVTAHLNSCAACSDTVGALRSLKAEAAALPGELQPGRDLWPEIEGRLGTGRAGLFTFGRRRLGSVAWGWPAGLAAAAVVLVVVTALVTMLLIRSGPERPMPRAATATVTAGEAVLASYRAAENDYLSVTEDLRTVLEQRRDELAPETIALLEENLRVVDEAIRQMWTALESDPGYAGNRHLFNVLYQKKVMLLQQAIHLPSQS